MRRKCRFCGADIQISNGKIDIVLPFAGGLCVNCLKWIESNLEKDPKTANPDRTINAGNSDIQVIPIKGEAKGKVENDKLLYPMRKTVKIVDTKEAGLAVFNLNAKFITSADKVRGVYIVSIESADFGVPMTIGKQKTINSKISCTVIGGEFPEIQSGIVLTLVVPHKGYIEYDVKVDGKLLTLKI